MKHASNTIKKKINFTNLLSIGFLLPLPSLVKAAPFPEVIEFSSFPDETVGA
jgi:hypothetical protein